MTTHPAPALPARRHPRLWSTAMLLLAAAATGVVAGVLLHLRQQHATAAQPALPAFHGQAVWAAGRRPAPGFSLHDQSGALVSLAMLRGKPVLLTFLDSRCTTMCPLEGRQLGAILRRLPAAQRPALIVVSVDHTGDTPASIRRALAEWHLTGPWTTHWLNAASQARLASVWRDYGVTVEPKSNDLVHSLALYLIDRRGDERTAYLFPLLPGFLQRDLGRLATA